VVINCAGLYGDRIAAMAGLDIDKEHYRLSYFKGEYYSVCSAQARRMGRRLIYPMLKPGGVVAIHTVLDTDGRVRLGPDFYPVDEVDYAINDSRKDIFLEGVRKLFSFVTAEDIDPESAGVMPRRFPRGQSFKEYVICHETDKGLPGFINVLGIESPGLTSSASIARHTARLVNEILTSF
jgi:L-2-hydroxyglutarate oxidase LhgO